jgi:hypothetical protein
MARHCKVVRGSSFDGNSESDPTTTLAKKVYDVVNGKTFVATAAAMMGQDMAVVIIYDD